MAIATMTSLVPQSMKGKVKKTIKSKKFIFASLVLVVGYSMYSNATLEHRARKLVAERERQRELITIDHGGGNCTIGSPFEDAPYYASENSTKTLVASYPGSGKRFTWSIMKALTNYEVADDWNFSDKLHKNPLVVKTSWPHPQSPWSWGNQMDQVLILMRNPRRSIPSFHTMRWELDYAKDWLSSWYRQPDTYRERPTVEMWEKWRDAKFNKEIDNWFNFYDFWMSAGFSEDDNSTHANCVNNDIDCQPIAVVDFESLYTDTPTVDFNRIAAVLDASKNVDVIANQARACVVEKVFKRTGQSDLNMHQAARPNPELPMLYKFTLPMFDRIYNRTIELRNKYLQEPHILRPHVDIFVANLNNYIVENEAEFLETVDLYLEDFVEGVFGDINCGTSVGHEYSVCDFMKNKDSHAIFSDGYYPDNFPYEDWLMERTVLVRIWLNNDGPNWTNQGNWMGTADHCTWAGVICSDDNLVTELNFQSNQLSGYFPPDLYDLSSLTVLNIAENSLVGSIPADLCYRSTTGTLFIHGDLANCPIATDPECCDVIDGLTNAPSSPPSAVHSETPSSLPTESF